MGKTLQLLVSAMHETPTELADKMQIDSDAIIVNQGETYGYECLEYKGHTLKFYDTAERGVGLSRNNALLRATADISVFSDEDIVYEAGYAQKILDAFEQYPQADMLLFQVNAMAGRETYHTDAFGRVRWYNCGRYPTYSFAIKTEKMHKHNITFSLLFGGGAKYSNGEDSLFLRDCLKSGLKVYKVPVTIGKERERESTWFTGYHEKFFFDRGVLYHHLYGWLAKPLSVRWLMAHKGELCKEIPVKQAYAIMKRGIREAKA